MRNPDRRIIKYQHWFGEGKSSINYVMICLKGKHKEHCLCHSDCRKFKPNTSENCPIAQATFENCAKFNIVTPMYECPEYKGKTILDRVKESLSKAENVLRSLANICNRFEKSNLPDDRKFKNDFCSEDCPHLSLSRPEFGYTTLIFPQAYCNFSYETLYRVMDRCLRTEDCKKRSK